MRAITRFCRQPLPDNLKKICNKENSMKRTIIAMCVTLAIAVQTSAQIPREKEQSNLEKFSSKSGVVYEKIVVGIGSLRGARVQAVFISDLIGATKTQGVKIE
jgi:hypothetical protein